MKIAGCFLVFAAGYLFSQYLMEPVWYHIKLLEEGEFLFRVMESEIRNEKIPLPQLFFEISQRTGSLWKDFFADLSEKLKYNGDFELSDEFACLLSYYFSSVFTEEERTLFYQTGRSLLSDDVLFHRDTSEQLSAKIQDQLMKRKEQADKRRRALQALCLSSSALLIVLLL